MKTNALSKIPVAGADRSRNHFNLAHDINTTCGFGEIQPILGRLTPADTKTTIDFKSLVRLAPMIAPTFGRMRFKTWTQFIPCSDVSKNFDAMMSQTNVTRPAGTFVPQKMAFMPLNVLSSLCFIGADVSIYLDDLAIDSGTGVHAPYLPRSNNEILSWFGMSTGTEVQTELGFFGANNSTDAFAVQYGGYTGWYFNLVSLLGPVNGVGSPFLVPTAISKPLSSSLKLFQLFENPYSSETGFNGSVHVSLEGADYVFSRVYNGKTLHYAFRFSSFGKRFAKQIKGLGYQVDLTNHVDVSLLPLFAEFLSYYEIFAPQLYDNWENTATAKLITFCDNSFDGQALNTGVPDCQNLMSRDDWQHYLHDWVLEMATMFVTDSQDWVSSHTEEMVISPSSAGALRFYDFDGHVVHNIYTPEDSNDIQTLPSTINDIRHGAWDEEFLKRALRWTNINTIAGKKVADLLRAQGLGDYVDSHKSHFIGYTEQLINISDVVSTSDTFKPASGSDAASGSLLGEYGGRGLSFNESQNFVYENNQIGFVITLCAIVPESGYFQGVDHCLRAIDKFSYYNREFDSIGMDMTPKFEICSARDFSSALIPDVNETMASFGFTPRMSGFKVANNVVNGDFGLRSTRSVYLPYTLDKYIALGEKSLVNLTGDSQHSNQVAYGMYDLLKKIPVAGVVWRYPTRYPWLANLQRIFANMQTDSKEWQMYSDFFGEQAQAKWLYCSSDVDNFLVHIVCNLQQFAPMLPIEKSFGTTDDENHANTQMDKS